MHSLREIDCHEAHTIRKKQKKDKKEAAKDIEEMGIELVDHDDEEEVAAPGEGEPAAGEMELQDPGLDNKRKAEEDLADSPNKQPKLASDE